MVGGDGFGFEKEVGMKPIEPFDPEKNLDAIYRKRYYVLVLLGIATIVVYLCIVVILARYYLGYIELSEKDLLSMILAALVLSYR